VDVEPVARLFEARPDAVHPVTRTIITRGKQGSAVDAFLAQYRLMECRRASENTWEQVDLIVTPTAGTIYRIDEVEADPVGLNSNLGYYTNFMNLLDYAAVAVPAGFGDKGLPYGVTLFGPAFADAALAHYGDRLLRTLGQPLGCTGHALPDVPLLADMPPMESVMRLVVCGAHLSGLPLNHQLTERGGRLLQATRTAARYRLYALPGGPPHRPGLIRQAEDGAAIEVEVWELPESRFGSFIQGIPAPLGIGSLQLEDGT